MSKLSNELKQAFEADIQKDAGDPTLLTMVGDVFRSRQRVSMGLAVAAGAVLLILAILCAVAFFQAEQQKGMLAYLGGFLALMTVISIMKVWFWMQMQRFAILREIKRLELEVARLRVETEGR